MGPVCTKIKQPIYQKIDNSAFVHICSSALAGERNLVSLSLRIPENNFQEIGSEIPITFHQHRRENRRI